MHRSLCATVRRSTSPPSASTSTRRKRSTQLDARPPLLVSLAELEAHDPALLSTKTDRTPVEYCWTATPALPLYMFATRPELDEVTYLDADLLFFADPEPLFEEMGDASVLITPHRFAPEYAHQAMNGIYNVQFLTFRRDERGLEVPRAGGTTAASSGATTASRTASSATRSTSTTGPSASRASTSSSTRAAASPRGTSPSTTLRDRDGRVLVDDDPLVFFHYHRVQLRREVATTGGRPATTYPGATAASSTTLLRALDRAVKEVRSVNPGFSPGIMPGPGPRERMGATRRTLSARARRLGPRLRMRDSVSELTALRSDRAAPASPASTRA